MLILSAYFLHRCFFTNENTIDTVFVLNITMFPLCFEGLYWIAAAARIIPSVFFISIACYFLTRYIKTKKSHQLILYIVSGVFSVGFYEIFIPVYIAVTLFIIIKHSRKYWLISFPIISCTAISVYYAINSTSAAISERFCAVHISELLSHTGYTLAQYISFFKNSMNMMFDAFCNGIEIVLNKPLSFIAIILLSATLGILSVPKKPKKPFLYLIFALILMFCAAALNFVIGFVRLPFRMFVPMAIGIAIIVKIFLNIVLPKTAYKLTAAVLAAVFSISNIGALSLYKHTYEADTKLANMLITEHNVTAPNKITFIFNAPQYHYNDRIVWYEYVKASTENYASITGQIRYLTQNNYINNIICLHENNKIGAFDINNPNAQFLYFDDDKFISCTLKTYDNEFVVLSQDNKFLGTLAKQYGYFTYTNKK